MKLDPRDAYQAYLDAERAASATYRQFWVTRFSLANIHFKPPLQGDQLYGYAAIAEEGKYKLGIVTRPAHFEGARVNVYMDVAANGADADYHWAGETKIRSESGFNRFIARFRNNGYQATPSLFGSLRVP